MAPTPIESRASWGARPPKPGCLATVVPGDVHGMAIHYSAGAADATGDPAARLRAFQNMHMGPGGLGVPNGGCDVAYNFAVHPKSGRKFELRGWRFKTGANGNTEGNRHYLSCVVLGDDKAGRQDVTPAGRKALAEIVLEGKARFGDPWRVRPHSDFTGTECPGDELRAWIATRGWEHDATSKLGPAPKNWFLWAEWYLGEGRFKRFGPKEGPRPKVLPKRIPFRWRVRMSRFLANRRKARR